ncbi:MAG TPA: DUF5615 family PIN-like protein [Blastocatellia bacterium]|nr:DUF5615 family PIN-like protein [Blastocatellia bacterium]
MKIRFQADNDLNGVIIRQLCLRNPEVDFQSARMLGLHEGISDDKVLELAAQENRILVSHDLKTMPDHFGRFILNRTSPGLILIAQLVPIGVAVEWLNLIWQASQPEEYVNRMYRIPSSW